MKRKLEENGDVDGPPSKHMYGPGQPYGGWQNRGQGNMPMSMPGGSAGGGGVGGYRGNRGGHWRGPRVPNNHNNGPRGGFFHGGGCGRGGPPRYPYDNSQQQYQQNQWHPQHYPYDQNNESNSADMDPNIAGSGCLSSGNYSSIGRVNSSRGGGGSSGSGSGGGGSGGGGGGSSGKGRVNSCGNDNSSTQAQNTTICSGSGVVVVEESYTKTKVKRRPMSQSYASLPWNKDDAERALAAESVFMKGLKNQSLIIRFPDPELSKEMVKEFHPGIENVHFQVPSGPRYCFVQLSENVNTDKVIKELQQIKFGNGKLIVEKKCSKEEDISPEGIDPYTLYIGNLPTNVKVASVVEKFPTATRIDIGFAQRMKFTRYAFIRYGSVDTAIEAYKQTHNLVLDSRSVIVRFRRNRGPVGLPGESRPQNPVKTSKKDPGKKEKDKDKEKEKKEKEKERERKEKEKEKEKEREKEKEKEKLKQMMELMIKPTVKSGGSDDEEEDDDDDDEDDEEEDDEDDESEDEEDSEDEDEENNDDDDDDDNNEADENDPDEKQDEEEDEDDEDVDLSRHLFQQIDEQIRDLGSIQ